MRERAIQDERAMLARSSASAANAANAVHAVNAKRVRIALASLAALLTVGAMFFAVSDLPFFSEDYTQLAWAQAYTRVSQALSLANEPLRPFQHLLFYVLTRSADPSPMVARIPAFTMHLASVWLVYVLARELSLTRTGALAASFVFLAFPNVKNLVWSASIGGPGRVVCTLAALDLYLIHARTRKVGALLASLACFVLALGFHESAIVLPVLCFLHTLVERGGSLARIPRNVVLCFRNPLLASLAATCAVYACYLAFLRPARHHGLRSFEALPANIVKAATSLAPEGLRAFAVDGLRGNLGVAGEIVGAIVVLTLVTVAGWCVVRGSKIVRFAVLAILLDLVLPALTTGFVQRYSYLGSAFAAVALATAFDRIRPRGVTLASLAVSALALAWVWDSWRDVREYGTAGSVVDRVLAQAGEARLDAPGRTIALVDVPDMGGSEDDLPLFNWGLEEALARARVAGPWLLWRTHAFHTSTSVVLVTRGDIDAARAKGVVVLEYDPRVSGLVRR